MNFLLYLHSVLEEEPKNIISCIHHFEFFKLFLDQLIRVVKKNNLISFSNLSFIAAICISILPYLCALMGLFPICSNSEQFLFAVTMIKAGSGKTVLF